MVQDNLARSGLEVYKTKDKNRETTSKNKEKEGLVLQNGIITEIAYFDEMTSNSFEHDYEDISSNGSVSFVEVDQKRFYKGKRVLLKKAHNPKKWGDLKNCLMGFITDQSFSEDGVEVKISGMSKLLEQEKQFAFKKTKRSKILKNIIESSGLKANINLSGLKDEKIDYTNVSSSNDNSGGGSSGDADLDAWVQNIIGSETDDLKKAKLIHNGLCKVLTYTGYTCSRYPSVGKAWKSKKLNCADTSRVTVAAFKSAGLDATVVHGPHHFWTIVKINGKEYASDATSSSRAFNSVWHNLTATHGKCGDEPSC